MLGPGSWFTSVIPHLLVPALRQAVASTDAKVVVVLNLVAEAGETPGFGPADHLRVLAEHAPDLHVHTVLADQFLGQEEVDELEEMVAAYGAQLVFDGRRRGARGAASRPRQAGRGVRQDHERIRLKTRDSNRVGGLLTRVRGSAHGDDGTGEVRTGQHADHQDLLPQGRSRLDAPVRGRSAHREREDRRRGRARHRRRRPSAAHRRVRGLRPRVGRRHGPGQRHPQGQPLHRPDQQAG